MDRRDRFLFALLVSFCLQATLWAAAPKPDVIVAADGSGQYTSVQAAISAAPMRTGRNDPRWVILVKPGTYRERIHVQRERGNMLVVGEDAEKTVIAFDLNANLKGPDDKIIGTFRTPTLWIDGDGMIWDNLTIANTAGPVGQALALRVDGDQVVFRRCRFLGWQDTILTTRGRQYFDDCYIEGHVDFIFGGATVFFDHCHIHALRDGYLTAASTPDGTSHGYVFADCKITGAEGVKTFLGRPWRNYARTVFIRTEMSANVRPEGWNNWGKHDAEQTTFYAEFGSTGPGANDAARVKWAKPLNATQAAAFTPGIVLAGHDGWNPLAGHKTHIVLVGDSTVNDGGGWGFGFRQFVTKDVAITNTGQNGRSSKSFRTEGHWDKALAAKGDYYLIQFGHNDQPGKGPERETDPATTYTENLSHFIDEVRAQGGQPILVTSLTRRIFSKTDPKHIESTLTPWADAAKKLGAAKGVPVIDLHASSLAYCEAIGPERTGEFNFPDQSGKNDTTHLHGEGRVVFARLVVDELRKAVPALAPVLRSEPVVPASAP